MARRRYKSKDDSLLDAVSGFFALIFVAVVWYAISNPMESLMYLFVALYFGIFGVVLWKWLQRKHFNKMLEKLKSLGQEDFLKNFINRFGMEGRKGQGYSFRNHHFEWDRINDLKKILTEAGVISKEKDAFILLRFYIQEKEENVTRESIKSEPQKLSTLSGTDFEKLLYRLFEAMGYVTKWIGKSGDQGGDLIANKNGERILVQAKAYRDWSTGNDAVQQAVAAMKFYDCNKGMVVTTSHFTQEAIALAHANNIELVPKERVQELFLKFLGESWS